MKVEKILKETIIQYYGNIRYRQPLCDITLYDWVTLYSSRVKDIVEEIRQVNKSDEVSAKDIKSNKLPCVTLSAYFEGYRNTNNIKHYNPIICIDIDKGDNPNITDWEVVKKKVMSLPFVMYASLSCRGEGVFCFVYYDITKNFRKVWDSLQREFENIGIIIDEACKDVTRLRFASFDNKTFIKNEVEMYDKEYEKPVINNDRIFEGDFNEDDEFTCNAIYYLIKYCGYRSNTYNQWLLDAFRLATLKSYGKLLFMYLSECSEGYNESYALNKFEEAERSSKMEKTCLSYYFSKLKSYLGSDWKNIVYKYCEDLSKQKDIT